MEDQTLCACILNQTVVSIVKIGASEYQTLATRFENVVDITLSNPAPQVGWIFNGNQIVPPPGTSAVLMRRITKLGLRRRFTFTELCALTGAAKTVVQVETLLGNLNVSTFVDLNRGDTVAGIMMLVSLGLLTADRANTILTAPIQDDEAYKGLE